MPDPDDSTQPVWLLVECDNYRQAQELGEAVPVYLRRTLGTPDYVVGYARIRRDEVPEPAAPGPVVDPSQIPF